MSVTLLFYVAIFVFAMMITGLALTIREFHNGEPARQDRDVRARSGSRETGDAAQSKAA